MTVTLPELLYNKDALAPHISAKTLEFHHGKHHNAYVTNLNKFIEGTGSQGAPGAGDLTRRAVPCSC
ncbi:MAG: hypothetical protein R6X05_16330 [Desulfobacterales bacterium]